MKLRRKTLILVVVIVAVVATPLVILRGAEFSGSDNQGSTAIEQLRPGFKPWFSPIWKPPSGEIESLFFALQAAIGTGVIMFAFGYWVGRRKRDEGEAGATNQPAASAASPPEEAIHPKRPRASDAGY